MNWITTSGRSLDEAKSHALDQLGIVADEAEFDIVNDVEKGLFGRIKTEAKVRARVKPRQPAASEDRNGGGRRRGRNRNRGGGNQKGNNRSGGSGQKNQGQKKSNDGGNQSQNAQRAKTGKNQKTGKSGQRGDNSSKAGGNNGNSEKTDRTKGGKSASSAAAAAGASKRKKKETVEQQLMNREDQEGAAQAFLEGVLGAFDMSGTVSVADEPADDDAIEMAVTGEGLGLLVGPKGATLNALQELTRTVVQREADGAKTNRLRVDVAGYRARRTAALQDFARKIAADVAESGTEKLLEPMGPADRKVVHDAVSDIDGVETGSEGEEPRRRVVIRPV